jgi:hypothetical protein
MGAASDCPQHLKPNCFNATGVFDKEISGPQGRERWENRSEPRWKVSDNGWKKPTSYVPELEKYQLAQLLTIMAMTPPGALSSAHYAGPRAVGRVRE